MLFYYTTVGWMMWNWLVSALSLGTTLVLYDGSPLHPHPSVMWDLVDECGITVFGTSAKWIAVQEDKGIRPIRTHRLTTLKARPSWNRGPKKFSLCLNSRFEREKGDGKGITQW